MRQINLRTLRDYQEEIHQATLDFMKTDEQRGQIYAPTGSGKTEMFFHLIADMLKNREGFKVCFLHPRLALSQEQQARFKDVFGDVFITTSFHSGQPTRGNEAIREIGTTDVEVLTRIITNADYHVTFSSYDSFSKIKDLPFDLIVYDEAHNATSPEFNKDLDALAADKVLFYTATPITDHADERGMTNKELFGPVIAKVEPKRLIENNYIVPPVVSMMDVTLSRQAADGVDTIEILVEAFKDQQKHSKQQGLNITKLLVTSRGYKDHNTIEDNIPLLWERVGSDVDVYVIEAENSRKNGVRLPSRFEALRQINESTNNCIVMHYDTIAEGIDINSLTGALILRKLSKSKLIQTIGRIARLMENKKYGFIQFPVVDGVHLGGIDAQTIVDAFREGGYGSIMDYMDGTSKMSAYEDGELLDPVFSEIAEIDCQNDLQELIDNGIILLSR